MEIKKELVFKGVFLRGDLDQDQWSKICLEHGASKELKNPLWPWIHRFLWYTMIQTDLGSLIPIQVIPKERTHLGMLTSVFCDMLIVATRKLDIISSLETNFIKATIANNAKQSNECISSRSRDFSHILRNLGIQRSMQGCHYLWQRFMSVEKLCVRLNSLISNREGLGTSL